MLLRSASSPVLKTFVRQFSTPEADLSPNISQTRPVSVCLERTSSESDLKRLSISKHNSKFSKRPAMPSVLIKEKEVISVCTETASSLLGDHGSVVVPGMEEEKMLSIGAGLGDGGSICGGGGGSGDSRHGPYGSENMDAYYQNMIQTYPGDALVLANYAKFLKEVRGDIMKAEEFCERAILADARDGNVLSMYGDLIWNNHRDADRAQTYFDQAVHSSPDDCYVLASYARFIWDAGEKEEEEAEEEEQDEQKEFQPSSLQKCTPPHKLPHGYPPLAAAS